MIKVIAFDFVGVLVSEKDIELDVYEDKLERLFGDNYSDEEYLNTAKGIVGNLNIEEVTKGIVEKLYEIKDKDLFNKIKKMYSDIKIVIATNHVSFIRDFINNNFDNLDDIIISSEIHEIKPHEEFYRYILNKYKIEPQELLFLDDNIKNVEGASNIGINAIKIDKGDDVFSKINLSYYQ